MLFHRYVHGCITDFFATVNKFPGKAVEETSGVRGMFVKPHPGILSQRTAGEDETEAIPISWKGLA